MKTKFFLSPLFPSFLQHMHVHKKRIHNLKKIQFFQLSMNEKVFAVSLKKGLYQTKISQL